MIEIRLTFHLKDGQSFGAGYRRGRGQGSSLDDLPGVANGTTEHHTEDHPNDLLRIHILKQIILANNVLVSARVFKASQRLTHHDSSDADAHVSNDVEFAVEELFDACLTVLQTQDKRNQAASSFRDDFKMIYTTL